MSEPHHIGHEELIVHECGHAFAAALHQRGHKGLVSSHMVIRRDGGGAQVIGPAYAPTPRLVSIAGPVAGRAWRRSVDDESPRGHCAPGSTRYLIEKVDLQVPLLHEALGSPTSSDSDREAWNSGAGIGKDDITFLKKVWVFGCTLARKEHRPVIATMANALVTQGKCFFLTGQHLLDIVDKRNASLTYYPQWEDFKSAQAGTAALVQIETWLLVEARKGTRRAA